MLGPLSVTLLLLPRDNIYVLPILPNGDVPVYHVVAGRLAKHILGAESMVAWETVDEFPDDNIW